MRFSKRGRRGVALVALVAASTLFAAGCSAGSLGSSSSEGSAGGTTITFLVDNADTTVASAKAIIDAFQSANPGHHRQDGHPPRRFRRRQPRQDASCPRVTWPKFSTTTTARCCRRLKPEQNLTPLDDQPWASQLDPTFAAVHQGQRRQAVRRAVGHRVRRRGAIQHPGLQEARPPDPEDLGRVHEEQRDHQEGRRHRPGRADLRRHLDLAAVRARRLPQRRGRRCRTSRRSTPPARRSTPPRRLRWRASSTSRQVHEAGYFNKDFASAKFNDGVKAIATGKAAHYPQLGRLSANIENVAPGKTNDVGFFACPARTRPRTA